MGFSIFLHIKDGGIYSITGWTKTMLCKNIKTFFQKPNSLSFLDLPQFTSASIPYYINSQNSPSEVQGAVWPPAKRESHISPKWRKEDRRNRQKPLGIAPKGLLDLLHSSCQTVHPISVFQRNLTISQTRIT